MSTQAHTPWSYEQVHDGGGNPLSTFEITTADDPDSAGFHVGIVHKKERAAFIVRAVNSHAAILAACRGFIEAIINEHNIPPGADDDYIYDELGSGLSGAFFAARAATAKAEEPQ